MESFFNIFFISLYIGMCRKNNLLLNILWNTSITIALLWVWYNIHKTTVFLKLHKSSTSEIIDLVSDNIPEWENNQAFIVNLSGLEFPTTVNLHHAYPNPFNPSTTIEYEIPEGGMHINLSIYDIRGRLVAGLVNEYQEASYDNYKVIWNASNMSSGVYFVRLHAGDTIKTQKIMLIK